MASGKGVIQGYTGVAAVDAAYQIVVDAQAHGTGSEQELLLPVVTAIAPLLAAESFVTADAGYHSDANLKVLEARGIEALIADNEMRRRDAHFSTQARRHAGTQARRHATRPCPIHFMTKRWCLLMRHLTGIQRVRSRTIPTRARASVRPASG